MAAALAIDRYGLAQLEKANAELRAEERELWRQIAALQSDVNSYAREIAAIDDELRAVERRMTERCDDVEIRVSRKINDVVETIRSGIRTVIAISAVLIALVQLGVVLLR